MKKALFTILTLILSSTAMAYNLHITKENYWEIANPEIQKEVWLSYCKTDSSLEIQEKVVGINPKTKERVEVSGDGICIWTEPVSKKQYTFHYAVDRITLGSDDIQINKAKEIAAKLGLKVYGDEGEEY